MVVKRISNNLRGQFLIIEGKPIYAFFPSVSKFWIAHLPQTSLASLSARHVCGGDQLLITQQIFFQVVPVLVD